MIFGSIKFPLKYHTKVLWQSLLLNTAQNRQYDHSVAWFSNDSFDF